jgi:Subtilase family
MPSQARRAYPNEVLRDQLIVAATPEVDYRRLEDAVGGAGGRLGSLFRRPRAQLVDHVKELRAKRPRVPDLTVFHEVIAREEHHPRIRRALRRHAVAYRKAPADVPLEMTTCADPIQALPHAITPTPNYLHRQGYLREAPDGIDAFWAWSQGGDGTGAQIVDIERAWNFRHEDLADFFGGVVGGQPIDCLRERNHGTAILGILSGDRNGFGVTGIAPNANIRAISIRAPGFPETLVPGTAETSAAIHAAADLLTVNGTVLDTGDIILLELQRPGPDGDHIPVEWWPDDLAAIRYATSLGLIVVAAAGNEGVSLDDDRFDHGEAGFPAAWTNPFRRGAAASGAIVVGAGVPPVGHHGRERSRLSSSNYGSMVDAQAWGREVMTTGYGDLSGGLEEHWYTNGFGGTSAAAAIVAGALACVQSARRKRGLAPLDARGARRLLRSTGSKQQPDAGFPVRGREGQRIGNLPNLRQMIPKRRPLR